jgi:hypothetical protein
MTSSSGPGSHVGEQVDQLVGVVVADRAVERRGRGEAVQAGVLVVELVAVARHLAQRGAQAGRTVAGRRIRLAFWSRARPMAWRIQNVA